MWKFGQAHLILFLLLLSGCAQNNKFATYYGGSGEVVQERDTAIQPQVVETLDIKSRVAWYKSKGFVILGESYFEGDWVSRTKAIDKAKKIGAHIVITTSEYMGTEERKYSFSIPTSNTSYVSGGAYTSSGYTSYSGTVTTYGSTNVSGAYGVGQYKQKAVFLAEPAGE